MRDYSLGGAGFLHEHLEDVDDKLSIAAGRSTLAYILLQEGTMKSRVYDERKVQWQLLRPDVSRGVNAKAIVPKELSDTTVAIA